MMVVGFCRVSVCCLHIKGDDKTFRVDDAADVAKFMQTNRPQRREGTEREEAGEDSLNSVVSLRRRPDAAGSAITNRVSV